MPSPDIRVEPAGPADAGEILTVQRAAYVAEAQLYGDPFILPLVESLDQVRAALSGAAVVLVARDLQGHGIGTRLMRAIEDAVAGRAETLALSTGHLSDGNLRLYRRLGYTETHRERFAAHLTLVHMRKKLPPPA